jgi:enoyl-CoA hydratase/carnithine racemase
MSTLKTLLVERVGSDKNIGLITLNRPHSLNAFNRQQFAELAQTLTELENDPSIKVIILTGSGNKAFSAGMDLKGKLILSSSIFI